MKFKLLLACSFLACFANAQSVVTDSTTHFFYYGIGYQYQSFGNLSDRIGMRSDFEKPGSSFFYTTVGGNKQSDLFLTDINIHLATAEKGDDEKKNSQMQNFGAAFTIGYNVLHNSKKIRLYPLVGVSIEAYKAKFNKDISAISFDSILVSNNVQQRTEAVTFSNFFVCYQGGIAVDFIQRRRHFLTSTGFRINYTGSFKKRSWRVNDNQVITNAPVDRVGQFSVAYFIGFGKRWGSRNPDFR